MRATPVILLMVLCLCSCVSKEAFERQAAATATANRAIENLRTKNTELLQGLSKRDAELKQRAAESDRCTAQLNAANADLQRYEDEQQRLENALGDTRQDATHAADSCQKRTKRLQAELSALKNRVAADRVDCQARLAGIKNTCDQLTGSLDAARGEAAARADSLKQDLDHCNDLRRGLEQQGDACRQKLATGDAVREDLTGRLAGLQAQFAVLQREHLGAEAAAAKRQAALAEMAARLRQGLQPEIARGKLAVRADAERVAVRIDLHALFAGTDTDLTPAGEVLLGGIGNLLPGAKGLEINIEGHGEQRPVSEELKKGAPSRWQLSTARAVKVMSSLRLQSKIPNLRLALVDFGPAPVLPAPKSQVGRAGEGHIDIVFLPKRAPAEGTSAPPNP